MTSNLALLCLGLAALSSTALAANAPGGRQGRPTTFPTAQAVEYKYISFLPDDFDKDPAKKWPLILFLHGAGERGDDLKILEKHGPHKFYPGVKNQPFVMIYPQCPAKNWWHPASLDKLLDEVSAKYHIDPDRIYLTGLSMGGFGSWGLSMFRPDRFAAIVPICGGGDPKDVARIKDIPIWVFHGAKDRAVPIQRSYDMITALAKINARVKYTIYPDADHDSWSASYANPELYQWLLAQRRGQPQQEPAKEVPSFK